MAPITMSVDLPAVHFSVLMGRRLVQSFARTAEIADSEIDCLMLVVSELLANAVDHGGGGGAMETKDLGEDVRMELRMSFDGMTWILSVEDQGAGDLAEAQQILARKPGDALAELEAERGRGLFLIHDMADELSVHRGVRGLVFSATKSL
ncbi:MAG: ATP-binding protein [Planctomycetota bacterium]|nr:ATP-binding protein [Planctomycetota bacterium]MDG2142880.1 ATP-binding protein [Planctomycetota bacterium]